MRKPSINIICALCAAVLLLIPVTANAENVELTVVADSIAVEQGEDVAVTLTVRGDSLAAAAGAYVYDPAVLTYVSAGGGAADGTFNMTSLHEGGADSLTAVIHFTATGTGETAVEFTLDTALDYSGSALGTAAAGVSVTVSGDGSAAGTAAVDISVTGIIASNVEGAAEQMYVWRSLTDLTLPSGYADRQVSYAGEYIGGAAIADTESPILLYLSNAAGENGAYYVYEAENDVLYPYTTLNSVLSTYTIMRSDGVTPPEGYEHTTLAVSDVKSIDVWQPLGGDGTVYLIYARASDGAVGFYVYDLEDRSIQRYMEPPVIPTPEPTPEPTPDPSVVTVGKPLYIGMMGGILALVIALAVALMLPAIQRKRRKAARREKHRQENADLKQ